MRWPTHRLTVGWPIWPFCFRIDVREPGDCFITLLATHLWGHFQQFLRRIGRKQTPTLMTRNQCIPCARTEWIDMNACARTTRSHHKPTIRRTTVFSGILEEIVLEILWHRVILQQLFSAVMLRRETRIYAIVSADGPIRLRTVRDLLRRNHYRKCTMDCRLLSFACNQYNISSSSWRCSPRCPRRTWISDFDTSSPAVTASTFHLPSNESERTKTS